MSWLVGHSYPADAVGQFMLLDKFHKVNRSLVCQEKDDTRDQELVIPIVVLAYSQLCFLTNCHDTNPESLRRFAAVPQV